MTATESVAARIFREARPDGDIVDRLDDLIPKCRGNSPGSQAREAGLTHCAECCFGTGIEATCDEELTLTVALMDAMSEIEALRKAVRIFTHDSGAWPQVVRGSAVDAVIIRALAP